MPRRGSVQVSYPRGGAPGPAAESPQRLLVTVPVGAEPGWALRVELNDGRVLKVTVPRGAAPGTKLAVDVPPRQVNIAQELRHAVETGARTAENALGAGVPPPPPNGMDASPFAGWSRWQLARALVRDGRTLRGERGASRADLERMAIAQFWGRPEAAKLEPEPTPKQRALLDLHAQRIQEQWIVWNAGRAFERMAVRANVDAQQWQRGGGAGAAPDASLLAEAGTGTLDANVPTMADFQRRHARRRGTAWTHSRKLSPEMLADNDGDEEEGGSGGARHSPMRQVATRTTDEKQSDDADAEFELDDELDQPWTRPSVAYARAWEAANHPRDRTGAKFAFWESTTGRHCVYDGCGAQLDLWDEGRTSEFGPFGIGVVLYFKFAKWLSWVFFVLSLLWLPAIVTNTYGIGVPEQSGTAWLAMTTIGNLGDSVNNSAVTMPGCAAFKAIIDPILLDDEWRSDLLDRNNSILETCSLSKNTISQTYAILDIITVLFLGIAIAWLRRFEDIEIKAHNRNTVSPADYTLKVRRIPPDTREDELVKHIESVLRPRVQSGLHKVARIALGYNNEDQIQGFRKRGKLLQQLFTCVSSIRYLRTTLGKERVHKDRRHKYLMKTRAGLLTALSDQDKDLIRMTRGASKPKPICAYVTFQHEKGRIAALKVFGRATLNRCCTPHELRLKGKHVIDLKRAAEPSTIIWENLAYPASDQFRRRAKTMTLAGFVVFTSLLVNYFCMKYQYDARSDGGEQECPADFVTLTVEEQYATAETNEELVHCYCDTLPLAEQRQDKLCQRYWKAQALAQFWLAMAAGTVSAVNTAIVFLTNKFARYEKFHSLDGEERSVMSRVFFLKLVNTGLIVLLLNSKLAGFLTTDDASAREFSTPWYATSGLTLLLTLCINIGAPHMAPFSRYFLRRRLKLHAYDDDWLRAQQSKLNYLTQDELARAIIGPPFHLSYRYAQLLVTYYIALIYGTGMPLLYPIGFISFAVTCARCATRSVTCLRSLSQGFLSISLQVLG